MGRLFDWIQGTGPQGRKPSPPRAISDGICEPSCTPGTQQKESFWAHMNGPAADMRPPSPHS